MKLWTIQSPKVYSIIQETGVYHCDFSKSENNESCFKNAYNWLSSKMETVIGSAPDGVKYPVWAYYTWNGNRKKPDFRTTMFRHRSDCVLMEIEIPDEQVLLTDYNNWHYVLNGWWFHNEDPEDVWDEQNDWWWNLADYDKQHDIAVKSWDKLIGLSESELTQKKDATIQATFWELKKDQIKKVWFHKGHNI